MASADRTEQKSLKMYSALSHIAKFDSPERLRRHSEKDYGVSYEEALEMAYENVLQVAKNAIKGLRIKRIKKT